MFLVFKNNCIAPFIIHILWGTLLSHCYVECWMNAMDKELNFQCPDGSIIYEINSKHINFFEDRVFEILCRKMNSGTSSCQWTNDYVNAVTSLFTFECQSNGVLAGMQSIHDNTAEDRRWKFYCCSVQGTSINQCTDLPKTQLDGKWSLYVPQNSAFRGVSSRHDKFYEDREYTFKACRLH